MKQFNLYSYMIISLTVLIVANVYQDIFTLRVVESVLISVITSVALDGFIIWKKGRKRKFPRSALITGLIIAAVIEPELDNRFIYFIPPTLAILSKHLIRTSNHNVFNPAAFGLTAVRLFYPMGLITWWATTPIYLVVPLGLFIVYKMRGLHLVLSFLLVSTPLYAINGILDNIVLTNSLGRINLFFALFLLTEHKSAPVANKAKIVYGSLIGILSFLFHVFLPEIENSATSLLIGNACAPLINKLIKMGGGNYGK